MTTETDDETKKMNASFNLDKDKTNLISYQFLDN